MEMKILPLYLFLLPIFIYCKKPGSSERQLQVSISNKLVLNAINNFAKKYHSTMGKKLKIMNLYHSSKDCNGTEIILTSAPNLRSSIMRCPIDKFAYIDSTLILIRGSLELSEWDEKEYINLVMKEFPLDMVANDWDFEKREPTDFRNFNQLSAKYFITDTIVETTTTDWQQSVCTPCEVPPQGTLPSPPPIDTQHKRRQ